MVLNKFGDESLLMFESKSTTEFHKDIKVNVIGKQFKQLIITLSPFEQS